MATLNNKIIELKQQNILTNVIDEKGEYSVDITDDVLLSDGDQVIMRNCFLDTSGSSSNQIKIDKDIDLTLTFNPYMMHIFDQSSNSDVDGATPFDLISSNEDYRGFEPLKPYNTGNHIVKGTGLPLFRTKVIGSDQEDEAILTEINVFYNAEKFGKTNQTWGGGPSISLSYEDYSGKDQVFHFSIPKITLDWSKRIPGINYALKNLHIPVIFNSVKPATSESILNANKCFFGPYIGGTSRSFYYKKVPSTKARYYRELDNSSLTVTLKEGLYQPSELANIITTKLQTSNQGEFISPGGILGANTCLVNAKNMFVADKSQNIYAYASSGYNFTSGAGNGGYAPLAFGMQSQGYWAGASQVALEFDSGANKFYWTYLHTPAYSANGEMNVKITAQTYVNQINPANANVAPNLINIPNQTIYTKKAGGIALISLEPADFWSGQLGFDLGELCIIPKYISMGFDLFGDGSLGSTNQTCGMPDWSGIIEGKTATAPRIINDVNISKTENFNQSGNVIEGQPVNTTEIYANNQVLEASINNAYWYVDVDSNFNNNIIGNQDTYKSTVGIVSNYYNSNSYTSGSSVDSIIYTHKGQDQQLSSFKVTILDSDRNKSELLGNDNTVFLEIVKNKSQVEQIIEQEKAVAEVKQMMKK